MSTAGLFLKKMLPAALAFATAWAARGQIGHEYGAAWAAAIGIGTVVILSGRNDWLQRFSVIVSLGAIAWGSGGIISYGMVVGYGQAADYINTIYGLLMLMVIGGLYGFVGGGVTGLALESSSEKKVDWPALLVQMFAGGFLTWGLLIYELEWLMTPPRSELWAACLGASLALGWYIYRNKYFQAFRVAFFSALGAGFGFAFGNFLQRLGNTSGIHFNWWNVMEYSTGFFSGLGLSYSVFAHGSWPKTIPSEKTSNNIAWVFLLVMLPALNLIEGITTERLMRTGSDIGVLHARFFAIAWQLVLWALSLALMIVLLKAYNSHWQKMLTAKKLMGFLLIYLTWYIIISNVVSAIWLVPAFSSQHLYWVNLAAIWILLLRSVKRPAAEYEIHDYQYAGRLATWWIASIILLLVLGYIAVALCKANPNAEFRFKF
ncbi:hypothetical protein [Parafilimonas sp.]|uniref:hypothetical protein n=1 Tax=Parafilimonas sp. TaxID=1969739 RepID=UPI0039E61FAC